MYVKANGSQIWHIFWDTPYIIYHSYLKFPTQTYWMHRIMMLWVGSTGVGPALLSQVDFMHVMMQGIALALYNENSDVHYRIPDMLKDLNANRYHADKILAQETVHDWVSWFIVSNIYMKTHSYHDRRQYSWKIHSLYTSRRIEENNIWEIMPTFCGNLNLLLTSQVLNKKMLLPYNTWCKDLCECHSRPGYWQRLANF